MSFCIVFCNKTLKLGNGAGRILVDLDTTDNNVKIYKCRLIENVTPCKYTSSFEYNDISIELNHNNTNVLPVYIVLMFHFNKKTVQELHSDIKWDFCKLNWNSRCNDTNMALPDHLKLLNFFLNLKDLFGTPLDVDMIRRNVSLKDKRGVGGERPRELYYKYGFPYYTSATKKFLKNNQRLFECPFPVCCINPHRTAIVPCSQKCCFTCGRKEGELNLFGQTTTFEKGHLTPVLMDHTTPARWQCKHCNTFYKDKIQWNVETQKLVFNTYAVMRDEKKKI